MSKTVSNLTLRKSFFDELWPLILVENRCDTHSQNTSEFFVPAVRFDNLWAHTYLAKKKYADYTKPVNLCCKCLLEPIKAKCSTEGDKEEDEDDDLRLVKPSVVLLTRQFIRLRLAQERRQLLGNKYVHRTLPWYCLTPKYDAVDVNYKLRPIELNILRQMHSWQCRLIIMHVPNTMRMDLIERWLRLGRYAKIVTVVSDNALARQMDLFHGVFYTCMMIDHEEEEDWNDELMAALEAGYNFAKELELLANCAKPFIFVFGSTRGLEKCNMFRVLRKF